MQKITEVRKLKIIPPPTQLSPDEKAKNIL